MKVLAIETSCDDTSLAIVKSTADGIFCEAMVAFHQIELHESYGGVVPELASREHLVQIIPVLYDLCYRVTWWYDMDVLMDGVDSIVVTHTPGLPGSLIMGRSTALFLSCWYKKPYQYINHLHGHIFSRFLDRRNIDSKKSLILSVSWWHSDLSILSKVDKKNTTSSVNIDSFVWLYKIQKIASTRDDAIGEVFDKVSRLLWGPYPGGGWISRQSEHYDAELLSEQYPFVQEKFKRILLDWTYDFSFSGMKSQAYNFITTYRRELWLSEEDLLPPEIISYLAYEFQQAAAEILTRRILQLVQEENISTVALVWWVSANTTIRETIQSHLHDYEQTTWKKVEFYTPLIFDYCTDNAAMIGVVWLLFMSS